MSISVHVFQIVSAEAHTIEKTDNSFSYVSMMDKNGNDIMIHVATGALHKERAEYLAEAIRLAYKVEFAIAEGFTK